MKIETKTIKGTDGDSISRTVIVDKDGEETVVLDNDFGKCKSIVVRHTDAPFGYDPADPRKRTLALTIEYENGEDETEVNPMCVLSNGVVSSFTWEDAKPAILLNKQVIAAIGKAAAEMIDVSDNTKLYVPSEDESVKIIEELGIPDEPIPLTDDNYDCRKREKYWMKQWKKNGKLCRLNTGDYAIVSAIVPYSDSLIVEDARTVAEKANAGIDED